MRIDLSFFCTAIFLISVASGCVSEEVVTENGAHTEGRPAFATFSVRASDAVTRAGASGEANGAGKISSIRVLVYSDNALDGLCEADEMAATAGDNAITVQLTSGWKKILIIANDYGKPWRLPDQKGLALRELVSEKTSRSGGRLALNEVDFGAPSLGSFIDTLEAIDFSSIASAQNHVFTNALADTSCRRLIKAGISPAESIDGKGEENNHFTIYLRSTMAKVTASFEDDNYPVITQDGRGSLTDLNWGVRNINRAVALFQIHHESGKPQAPFFYELTGWSAASLNATGSYKRYWWTRESAPTDISTPMTRGNAAENYCYIPENANYMTIGGNTTYIAVRATFTPAANTVVTGFAHSNATRELTGATRGSIKEGSTFYRLSGLPGTAGNENLNRYGNRWIISGNLFSGRDLALRMAYIAEHEGSDLGFTPGYVPQNIKVDEYSDGHCYYRADIKNGSKPWIERNKIYHGKVSSFLTLGDPDLNDLGYESVSTFNVNISVIDWTEISTGGEV